MHAQIFDISQADQGFPAVLQTGLSLLACRLSQPTLDVDTLLGARCFHASSALLLACLLDSTDGRISADPAFMHLLARLSLV